MTRVTRILDKRYTRGPTKKCRVTMTQILPKNKKPRSPRTTTQARQSKKKMMELILSDMKPREEILTHWTHTRLKEYSKHLR